MARNKVQFQKGMSEARIGELREPLCQAALVRWRADAVWAAEIG